jgi:phosphoglycerate dehydrogenase-like enzyme
LSFLYKKMFGYLLLNIIGRWNLDSFSLIYLQSTSMKPRSIFHLNSGCLNTIYSANTAAQICQATRNDGQVISRESILADPASYEDVEYIFSGWGCAKMDEDLLAALPRLKALFYGAGSVRNLVTDAFWERQIHLTSAYKVNAVPVAEFTVASITLGLKQAYHFAQKFRRGEPAYDKTSVLGMYHGAKVGIISLGAIGQLVCNRLKKEHEVDVIAYDPFASDELFASLGVQRVAQLEDLFEQCRVVSLHTPWLPETENLIRGSMLKCLPENSTFINTSRGMIVNEAEMTEVLTQRSDIHAVLDLLQDEQHMHLSPLAKMGNVTLTPHVAGSTGLECHRMGDQAWEECRRFLAGEPAICVLTKDEAARLA